MRADRWLLIGLLCGAGGLPGCQLPHNDGTPAPALITSRHYSQQAAAAIERSQWDQAETLLVQALKTCPLDNEARRYYAETLWHRGACVEAIGQLEEARQRSGEDAGLCARLAEMQLAMGQVEKARVGAEQALDLDPKLATAWVVHARVMRAARQQEQALADYHRALAYAPDDRQILLEVAELHRELGQPQRAIVTLQSLCDTYGPGEEPQQVLYLLGLAYQAAQRYDDAADSFSTAMLRGRPTPEILYRLAEAQWSMGRSAAAAAAAREAISLDPRHQPSRELLNRLDIAQQEATPRR
jgi:tetratricopeptide (TPR) repeat protein